MMKTSSKIAVFALCFFVNIQVSAIELKAAPVSQFKLNNNSLMNVDKSITIKVPSQFVVFNGLVPHGGTSENNQHKYRLGLILKDGSSCTIKGFKNGLTSRIRFFLKNNSCDSSFMQKLTKKQFSHIRFYGNTDGVYVQSVKLYGHHNGVVASNSHIGVLANFPLNRWVDNKTDDRQMTKDIYLEGDSRITKYEITIRTSTIKKAGTDARIRLSLIDRNEVNSIYNYQPDDKQNNFEKGSVDKFTLYAPNIPNLAKICVNSDGRGDGAGWYPNSIIVKDTKKNKIYNFPLDRWILRGDEVCRSSF